MFISIVFWLGRDRPSALALFRARFTSFHTRASLTFIVSLSYFILAFLMDERLWKHVHEFHISYSHTEWYPTFSRNGMIEIVEESPVEN